MDQIEELNPPPSPAKITDSRSGAYIEEYGWDSWELDALDPTAMVHLIEKAIAERTDEDARRELLDEELRHLDDLSKVERHWDHIIDNLRE